MKVKYYLMYLWRTNEFDYSSLEYARTEDLSKKLEFDTFEEAYTFMHKLTDKNLQGYNNDVLYFDRDSCTYMVDEIHVFIVVEPYNS